MLLCYCTLLPYKDKIKVEWESFAPELGDELVRFLFLLVYRTSVVPSEKARVSVHITGWHSSTPIRR